MKKDFEKILPHEKYDDFYSNLNYAEKNIFDNVIESENHREYDLRKEIFYLKDDNRKLGKKVKSLNGKVKSLKDNNRKLKKEIKSLNKKINNLNKFNKSILSSKSWKLTKPFRAFVNFFRKL